MRMDTQKLALTSLMTSLIMAATIVIRIPIPLTQGYIHLGDRGAELIAALIAERGRSLRNQREG